MTALARWLVAMRERSERRIKRASHCAEREPPAKAAPACYGCAANGGARGAEPWLGARGGRFLASLCAERDLAKRASATCLRVLVQTGAERTLARRERRQRESAARAALLGRRRAAQAVGRAVERPHGHKRRRGFLASRAR